jgi:hypothetical protein
MPKDDDRLVEVARRLTTRTKAGRQHWTQNDSSPGHFQTRVAEQLVLVGSTDSDGNHPYSITIWRPNPTPEDGKRWIQVESLNTARRNPGTFVPAWQEAIADLWAAARTEALQIDSTMNAILTALED